MGLGFELRAKVRSIAPDFRGCCKTRPALDGAHAISSTCEAPESSERAFCNTLFRSGVTGARRENPPSRAAFECHFAREVHGF